MMDVDIWVLLALAAVAMLAGFIDAIAGGGGLLTIPALLFAGVPPVQALATNKLQSATGTVTAATNFIRAGLVNWRAEALTVLVVLAASAAGVLAVQQVDAGALMLLIPVLLLGVAIYVLLSPRMTDTDHPPRISVAAWRSIAGAIGFYDGFFGPGTGSFFNAGAVGLRGVGLTRATGMAKLFNASSNVAALAVWIASGQIIWIIGLAMALGNMTGAWLGSHTAIRFGAPLIRPLLVLVSLSLTAKVMWDYFHG